MAKKPVWMRRKFWDLRQQDHLHRDRIDHNEDGVDDVVIGNVETFRMERMTDECFWIRLYRKSTPDLVFHIAAPAGVKVLARVEED